MRRPPARLRWRFRGIRSSDIEKIQVRCSAAAVAYPGCNYAGPFGRILQAKMSIHYCVAATLAQGKIAESNYHLLDDPEVMRLVGVMTLEAGRRFHRELSRRSRARRSRCFCGTGRRTPADWTTWFRQAPDEIRARFRSVCQAAKTIESFIDDLEDQEDVGLLCKLLERD